VSGINVIKLDFSSSLTAVQNKLERLSPTENLTRIGDKHSSLFCRSVVIEEEKKVLNINAWGICYKYFTGPLI
jgi:hypothetical protein